MTSCPSRASRGRLLRVVVCCLLALYGVAIVGGCASKKGPARPKRTVLLTRADDRAVGQDAAKQVESQIGLLDDEELTAYVAEIGRKLLRGVPRREFAYRFVIVDQMEPNAFALPGGFIFVSRGLIAQANNEDELACVLGHEIVHSERRHAAQQQAVARAQGPLGLPRSRAATLAAYGRDMEREADALGQRLCAAAGYDPMGMSTFLRGLDQRERLLTGQKRVPTFFDTHPGSRERAASASMLARELRWDRDEALGDTRARLLDHVDGMVIGDRPETGIFIDNRFVHPGLGFEIQFPRGWTVQNSNSAVGAIAPRGEAVVYLTADLPPGDLEERANEFAEKTTSETGLRLTSKRRVRMGDIDAVRYGFEGGGMGLAITARVTFFPFAGSIWRIVGVAPSAAANRYLGPILITTRSFRVVDESELRSLEIQRLRVVLSREGEDIIELGDRTGNAWNPAQTALLNGLLGNYVFDGGELVKIIRVEGVKAQ